MVERSFLSTYQLELSFVILFIIIVNIILLYLYRYSELISKRTLKNALFSLNFIIVGSVIASYIALKPIPIEKRVMIIPEFSNDSTKNLELLMLTNQLEQNLRNSKQRDILIMSFWWIYDAINKEHLYDTKIYDELAVKAGIHDIYKVKLTSSGAQLSGVDLNLEIKYSNQSEMFEAAKSGILSISGTLDIDLPEKIRDYIDLDYIKALCYFYNDNFDALFAMSNIIAINESTMLPNLVIARAYIRQGARIKENVNFDNPYHNKEYLRNFREAQRRLFIYINKDALNPDFYVPLVELQLYQESYDDADASIKGYLTDFGTEAILRRTEADMYYLYSFLSMSKIKQDGYRSRLDIIKESIEINPFFEKSYRRYMSLVLKNANITSQTVDILFKDLENYLSLNNYSDSAKFILAEAFLERGEIIRSRRIYLDLVKKYPDRSFIHYGIGIANFRMSRRFEDFKQFAPEFLSSDEARNEAIKNFNRAIEIDGFVNSYLYLGVLYDEIGDKDKAIKYFRLRIRNKLGDVDKYADEAKKGLRKIFEDSTILNRYLREEDMLRDDAPF